MERLTRKTINSPASRPFAPFLIFGLLLVASLIFSSYQVLSSSSQSVYNKKQKTSVPFFARLVTSIQIIGQQVRSAGTGTATHLGKTTFEVQATVNFAVQPAQINGTATFTAANGDQFYTSFSGVTRPNGTGAIVGDFNHEITGGTGRFTDISGSLTGHSVHQIGLQSGSLIFDGMIDY